MTIVSVNGADTKTDAGSTVADLVAAHCPSAKGVAVALNGEVVPRSNWESTAIRAGDRIEIVTAAAGG